MVDFIKAEISSLENILHYAIFTESSYGIDVILIVGLTHS